MNYPKRIISESSAFLMGHRYGRAMKQSKTPRQVSEQFPHWPNGHVDAYLNGLDDAILSKLGDQFGADIPGMFLYHARNYVAQEARKFMEA